MSTCFFVSGDSNNNDPIVIWNIQLVNGGAYICLGQHGGDAGQRSHQSGRPTVWGSRNGKVEDRTERVGLFLEFAFAILFHKLVIENICFDTFLPPFFQNCGVV